MSTDSLNDILKQDADLPDPSDFPPHSIAPGLRQLDDALRCSICRELFDAPVTLPCGHSYCSECVRGVLSDKQECPICRKSALDIHLRKNLGLEGAVKAWSCAREFVLRLSKDEEVRSPKKRRRGRSSSQGSDDDIQFMGNGSREPTRYHKKKVLQKHPGAGVEQVAIEQNPDIVVCPICGQNIPHGIINRHIDSNCKTIVDTSQSTASGSKGKQRQEWSALLNGGGAARKGKQKERVPVKIEEELEYLPKVNYDVLSSKMLQEKLAEHSLPNTGNRNAKTKRHTKWVMMWNANVDRSPADRKSLDQMRQDLVKWEEEQKSKKQTVTDTVAYERANKAQFEHLIQAARPKKNVQPEELPPSSPIPTSSEPGQEILSEDES